MNKLFEVLILSSKYYLRLRTPNLQPGAYRRFLFADEEQKQLPENRPKHSAEKMVSYNRNNNHNNRNRSFTSDGLSQTIASFLSDELETTTSVAASTTNDPVSVLLTNFLAD